MVIIIEEHLTCENIKEVYVDTKSAVTIISLWIIIIIYFIIVDMLKSI